MAAKTSFGIVSRYAMFVCGLNSEKSWSFAISTEFLLQLNERNNKTGLQSFFLSSDINFHVRASRYLHEIFQVNAGCTFFSIYTIIGYHFSISKQFLRSGNVGVPAGGTIIHSSSLVLNYKHRKGKDAVAEKSKIVLECCHILNILETFEWLNCFRSLETMA